MRNNIPPADEFSTRHIGPDDQEISKMLEAIGLSSLNELITKTVPEEILDQSSLGIGQPLDELNTIKLLRQTASKNNVTRSYIGMGYTGTITPPVILRNVLENPGWYTQYLSLIHI